MGAEDELDRPLDSSCQAAFIFLGPIQTISLAYC